MAVRVLAGAVGATLVGVAWLLVPLTARPAGPEPAGHILGIEGNVFVAHAGARAPAPVAQDEPLRAGDALETQPRSRVKVVVADDTLISIGESSRFSLLDYRSGERSRRSITANVDRGTIRALIGHAFSGNAGRFEIRTPTAVVVSRGSPLAIWIEEIADGIVDPLSGLAVPASVSTGIANLGETGSVTVSACGQSHGLGPGQYVIAGIDCRTLVPAAVAAAPSVQPLLSASEFRQAPRLGTASQALQAMGAAATIIPQPSAPATGRASRTDASVAGTTSGTAPVVPVTPPAVISGAAGLTPNGTTATAATAQGSATATPTTAPPSPPPAPAPAPPHAPPPPPASPPIINPPPPPPAPPPAPPRAPPPTPPSPPIIIPPPPPPPPPAPGGGNDGKGGGKK